MNFAHRKPLANSKLDFFDTREVVEAISTGSYDKLPYTSKVLAENLVRRCAPERLTKSLKQIIERKRELDFPWFPARVVCHDILGQTALVDLAGLRDAIAQKGGDPAKVNHGWVDCFLGMVPAREKQDCKNSSMTRKLRLPNNLRNFRGEITRAEGTGGNQQRGHGPATHDPNLEVQR